MLVIVILLLIVLCFPNSDKTIAKDIYSLTEETKDDIDYYKTNEELYNFLNSDNCGEIINEYYSNVFKLGSPQQVYAIIYAIYDATLLHLGRYDDFKNSVVQNSNLYSNELYMYSNRLWTELIVLSPISDDLNTNQIKKSLLELDFENSEQRNSWDIFIYYFNLFNHIDISEDLKSNVINLSSYESHRMGYVMSFLTFDKFEEFDRLFVQEYQNDPFTGVDIMYLIQQEILTEEQLTTLDNSLENLEEAYLTNRPNIYPLKKEIIDNLQKMIQEQLEDGSPVSDDSNN